MKTENSIRARYTIFGSPIIGILLAALAGLSAPTHAAPPSPPIPPHPDCVNTLDYFIGGDKYNWKGSNGRHKLSQNFSSNPTNGFMYYIKFGNPYIYEYFTWDANYIYLRQDGYPITYTFSNGKWLKNGIMCKGETVYSGANLITWYDSNCRITQAPQSYPISNTLVDHWPNYFLGGSRGYVDVILVDYHYPGSRFERNFYSKQYGWVRWEAWENGVITDSAAWDTNDSVTLAITTKPPQCVSY